MFKTKNKKTNNLAVAHENNVTPSAKSPSARPSSPSLKNGIIESPVTPGSPAYSSQFGTDGSRRRKSKSESKSESPDYTLDDKDLNHSPTTKNKKINDMDGGLASEISRSTNILIQHRESPISGQGKSFSKRIRERFIAFGAWFRAKSRCFKASVAIFTLIILLVIIGASIFASLYKGLPGLWITDAAVNNDLKNPDGSTKQPLQIDLSSRPPKFNLSVLVNAASFNPNLMDLQFDDVQVVVTHWQVQSYVLGTASLGSVLLLQNSTQKHQFPIVLLFDFSKDPSGTVATDFVNSCTTPAGKTEPIKQLQFIVQVVSNLRITSLIKVKAPIISSQPAIKCPFPSLPSSLTIDGIKIDLNLIDWAGVSKGQYALKNNKTQ